MSLLDMFRKKGQAPAPGASTPTPVPAPPLPGATPVAAPSAAETATNLAAAGDLAVGQAEQPAEPNVRVFDEFGREVLIPVSQWRNELLPQALEQAKTNPDALAALLLDALQTGATTEIVPAAAHLQATDPNPERGAAINGLVLLAAGQVPEAEDVLVTYLGQYGPSAPILTHLARAQAAQNRLDEADATLWRALEADPNDDGAVGLYAARSREREGDFGWQSALERAATLPGAWLPLMWLGRSALDGRNRSLAVALYKQALESAGRPVPLLLLQGISGDLGQFGLLDDAIRLVRPNFEPELHGLIVGNNLIKATLDNGEPAEALNLVRELANLNRPEFAEALRTWEIEIRRRELIVQAQQNPPQPQLLRIDGPVWLPVGTPGRQLYNTAAPRRGGVLFLGSSVTMPVELPQDAGALQDVAGRLSRALPLFLAENAFTLLTLESYTMVPWADIMGFAMLSQPWPDGAAAAYARDAGAGAAVTTHLEATPEGATVTLRLIPAAMAESPAGGGSDLGRGSGAPSNLIQMPSREAAMEGSVADRPAEPNLAASHLDASQLDRADLDAAAEAPSLDAPNLAGPNLAAPGVANEAAKPDADELPTASGAPAREPQTITLQLTWPELHTTVQSLWPQLAIHLVTYFGDTPEPPQPGRYNPPRGADLNIYLRLLEQLLSINCAAGSRNGPLLLTGERETLRAMMDLAVRYPNSLPVRLMLGEALLRIRGLHPEVLFELMEPLRLLQERNPFPDPEAGNLLQAQMGAALNFGQQQQQQQPSA